MNVLLSRERKEIHDSMFLISVLDSGKTISTFRIPQEDTILRIQCLRWKLKESTSYKYYEYSESITDEYLMDQTNAGVDIKKKKLLNEGSYATPLKD